MGKELGEIPGDILALEAEFDVGLDEIEFVADVVAFPPKT